jgi:hypothetical protein
MYSKIIKKGVKMRKNLTEIEMREIEHQIIQDLENPENAKLGVREIASLNKVEPGFVISVIKKNKIKRPQKITKQSTTDILIPEDTNSAICIGDDKKVRKRRTPVTDDLKLNIASYKEEHKQATYKELTEVFNISQASVYRILKEFDIPKNEHKNISEAVVKDPVVTEENPVIRFNQVFNEAKIVKAGLIADRHDMPVDSFIFSEVPEHLMFNYTKQLEICNDFITKNFHFSKNENGDDYAKEALEVYATGLGCCLASIIRACSERHINLYLMHYNTKLDKYLRQNIFDSFDSESKQSIFQKYLDKNYRIMLYDCEESDLKSGNEYWSIKLPSIVNGKIEFEGCTIFVFQEFNECMNFYTHMLQHIIEKQIKNRGLVIEKFLVKEYSVYFNNEIYAKSFPFM